MLYKTFCCCCCAIIMFWHYYFLVLIILFKPVLKTFQLFRSAMGNLCSYFSKKNVGERDDVESNKSSKKHKGNNGNHKQDKNVQGSRSVVKQPANRSRSQSQEKHHKSIERDTSSSRDAPSSSQNSYGRFDSASVIQEKKKNSIARSIPTENTFSLSNFKDNSNRSGASKATVVSYQTPTAQKTQIQNNSNYSNVQQHVLITKNSKPPERNRNLHINNSPKTSIPQSKSPQYKLSGKPPIDNYPVYNSQYSKSKIDDHVPQAIPISFDIIGNNKHQSRSHRQHSLEAPTLKPQSFNYQENIVGPVKTARNLKNRTLLETSFDYEENTNKSPITPQSSSDPVNQLLKNDLIPPKNLKNEHFPRQDVSLSLTHQHLKKNDLLASKQNNNIPQIISNSNKTVSEVEGENQILVIRQNLGHVQKVTIPSSSNKSLDSGDSNDLNNLKQSHGQEISSVTKTEDQKLAAIPPKIAKPINNINTVQSSNQYQRVTKEFCEPLECPTPTETHINFMIPRKVHTDELKERENSIQFQQLNEINNNPPLVDKLLSLPKNSFIENVNTSNIGDTSNIYQSSAYNEDLLGAEIPNDLNIQPLLPSQSNEYSNKPNDHFIGDKGLSKVQQMQSERKNQIGKLQSELIKTRDTSRSLLITKKNDRQIYYSLKNQYIGGERYNDDSFSTDNVIYDDDVKSLSYKDPLSQHPHPAILEKARSKEEKVDDCKNTAKGKIDGVVLLSENREDASVKERYTINNEKDRTTIDFASQSNIENILLPDNINILEETKNIPLPAEAFKNKHYPKTLDPAQIPNNVIIQSNDTLPPLILNNMVLSISSNVENFDTENRFSKKLADTNIFKYSKRTGIKDVTVYINEQDNVKLIGDDTEPSEKKHNKEMSITYDDKEYLALGKGTKKNKITETDQSKYNSSEPHNLKKLSPIETTYDLKHDRKEDEDNRHTQSSINNLNHAFQSNDSTALLQLSNEGNNTNSTNESDLASPKMLLSLGLTGDSNYGKKNEQTQDSVTNSIADVSYFYPQHSQTKSFDNNQNTTLEYFGKQEVDNAESDAIISPINSNEVPEQKTFNEDIETDEGAKMEYNKNIHIKDYSSYYSHTYSRATEHNTQRELMPLEIDNLETKETEKQNVIDQMTSYDRGIPLKTNLHIDDNNYTTLSDQSISVEDVSNENHPNEVQKKKLKLDPSVINTVDIETQDTGIMDNKFVQDSQNVELFSRSEETLEIRDKNKVSIVIDEIKEMEENKNGSNDTNIEKEDEKKLGINKPLEIEYEQIKVEATVYNSHYLNQDYVDPQLLEKVTKSLKQTKEKAKPLVKEIEMFTELEDSNKYYYIEESLRRLIDKLDDMFEDIGESSVLREKRKKVYKFIFPLFDKLDDKVAENKERIERERSTYNQR